MRIRNHYPDEVKFEFNSSPYLFKEGEEKELPDEICKWIQNKFGYMRGSEGGPNLYPGLLIVYDEDKVPEPESKAQPKKKSIKQEK